MSEPEEKWSRHHIICPHCGYERRAEAYAGAALRNFTPEETSRAMNWDEQEEECGECGKEFVRYASISITYHTKPKGQP